MQSRDVPADAGFLRDHVAHDVKFLAFATAEFRRLEDRRYEVPLQDSALVRGRTLLNFLIGGSKKKNFTIRDFLADASRRPPSCPPAEKWSGHISARLAHFGKRRHRSSDIDQWPGRDEGVEKGEDRLDRLALLVVELLRDRADYVRPACGELLVLIAQRAEEYLADPTELRFHAMDPANL